MTEANICKFCFGDENQENLIAPCGCTGSMRFVHKECLTNWLKNNKGDKRYFECNECKKEYKRLIPSDQDSIVDFEMSTYTLALTLGSAIILVLLLFLCGLSTLLCSIILFILYVITVSSSIRRDNILLAWVLIFLFVVAIFSNRKIKTFIVSLWLLFGYGLCVHEYLDSLWFNTKQCILSNYMINIKPKIYDNYTRQYVEGVI